MPSPYDYASGSGYARTTADWADGAAGGTPITAAKLDTLEQAIYDIKHEKFNVFDYGVVGDGATDDTSAMQALITTAGTHSTIWIPAKNGAGNATDILLSGTLQPLEGQHFESQQGGYLYGQTFRPRIGGYASGAQFDLQDKLGVTLEGLQIYGDQSNASSKGVIGSSPDFPVIRGCMFKSFGGQAIQFTAGVRPVLEHIEVQTALDASSLKGTMDRATAPYVGAVEIDASDAWLADVAVSLGSPHATSTRRAGFLIGGNCAPGTFINCIAQVSCDIGWVIGGWLGDYHGCRADANQLEGFLLYDVLVANWEPFYNTFVGCLSYQNSQRSSGASDGFRVEKGWGNVFMGNRSFGNLTGTNLPKHRYAYRDEDSSGQGRNTYLFNLAAEYATGEYSSTGTSPIIMADQTNHVLLDKQLYASAGVTLPTKASAPTDSDTTLDQDGTLWLDSTNHRLYVRSGGVWKYAALT